MRSIQLLGTGSATATGVASVLIPTAGRIKGVLVAVEVDSVTDNSAVYLELSPVNASAIGAASAQDPFLEVRLRNNLLTSGMTLAGINQFFPLDIDVRAGQPIFLHAYVVGTAVYAANFIIYWG